jgi:hypothetical protein
VAPPDVTVDDRPDDPQLAAHRARMQAHTVSTTRLPIGEASGICDAVSTRMTPVASKPRTGGNKLGARERFDD